MQTPDMPVVMDTPAVSIPPNRIRDIVEIPSVADSPVTVKKVNPKPAAWRGKPYLRGPIPLAWIRAASRKSRGCLLVGLGLWHLRSLNKNTSFPATMRQIAGLVGVSHRTVQRGVTELCALGLLKIEWKAGSRHTYTLIGDE